MPADPKRFTLLADSRSNAMRGYYTTPDDTLAEVLADGYFDPLRTASDFDVEHFLGFGGRMDIQASDGVVQDVLYLDGSTLKLRAGAYRLEA